MTAEHAQQRRPWWRDVTEAVSDLVHATIDRLMQPRDEQREHDRGMHRRAHGDPFSKPQLQAVAPRPVPSSWLEPLPEPAVIVRRPRVSGGRHVTSSCWQPPADEPFLPEPGSLPDLARPVTVEQRIAESRRFVDSVLDQRPKPPLALIIIRPVAAPPPSVTLSVAQRPAFKPYMTPAEETALLAQPVDVERPEPATVVDSLDKLAPPWARDLLHCPIDDVARIAREQQRALDEIAA